ncbi:MAG: hypothetical protein HY898_31420 [Deltaproteobacteria bacterium]|nr:hypothetical protein [Deltaproteobacteria bacterium]
MATRIPHLQPIYLGLCFAALAHGCGARTPLNIDDGQAEARGDSGADSGGDADATSPGCGHGGTGKVLASLTLDPPSATSEPEGAVHLAWTGSQLLAAWTRWTNGNYKHVLAAVQVNPSTLAVSSSSTVDPGSTTNPFNSSIAWDGARLGRFWAQDDGSIVMQRFGSDAASVDAVHTVVPPTGAQTIPTGVIVFGGSYIFSWAVQQTDGWITYGARMGLDGTMAAPPTLFYAGSGYDLGAVLASNGSEVFAAWSTHPKTDPMSPITTTLAAIDPATAAVDATEDIDTGVDHNLTDFAVETDRFDVCIWNTDAENVTVLARPFGAATFKPRAVIPVTSSPLIAADRCGLVALLPTGKWKPDNGLATTLSLQRIGEQGVIGDAVKLPVTGQAIESWSLAAIDGGFAVAWIEYQDAASPSRVLRLAYVTVP